MKILNLTDEDRARNWHVVRDVNKWVVLMELDNDNEARIGAFFEKSRCREFFNA